MTIYLPSDPVLFREAFDAVCDRILRSEQDIAFYTLYIELVSRLQEHPYFKDYLFALENESGKKREEFSIAALEALEDSWMKLWKYHRHSLKHRKQLIRIKQMVTAPHELSYSPLCRRILFLLWEFRYFSPFFRFIEEAPRLLRSAQFALYFSSAQFDHLYPSGKGYFAKRKVAPLKFPKKDKRRGLCKRIFDPGANNMPFKQSAEQIHSAYFCSKTEQIEKRFFLPGQNDHEKKWNMQIMAETDAAFCWERIRFLQQCYAFNEAVPLLNPLKGRWKSVREKAWKSAQERCEIEVLLGAKMAFNQKLSHEPCSSVDSFLMYEHQIHRGDYEKYLQTLKNHIEIQLFRIQNALVVSQAADATPAFAQLEQLTEADRCRVERENFIVDHAKKYRAAFPFETNKNMFIAYRKKCPRGLEYAMTKWKEIIKKHQLDPRTPEEKKKNSGRPCLK
jgi:hypothetical protein